MGDPDGLSSINVAAVGRQRETISTNQRRAKWPDPIGVRNKDSAPTRGVGRPRPNNPSGRWCDRDSVGPSEFRTFQYLTLQREIHHSWKSNVFGSPIYYWPLLVKTEFLENASFSENGRISESPPWRGRRAENAGRRKKFLQYRPRNPEFYRDFSKSMAIWRAAK